MSYTVIRIGVRMYRIVDSLGVAMYLVCGSRRAALLDTGCGVPGLAAVVRQITNLPVTVLLSHGHVDHAMGAGEFGSAHMNLMDLPVYRAHAAISYRQRFVAGCGFSNIELEPHLEERALKPLRGGDVFDLGGVTVEAYAVPGHTHGSMIFLVPEERAAMFGDACGPGTILLEDWSTDVKTYRRALESVRVLDGRYDRIVRNHGTYESPVFLLETVIEVCDAILSGHDDRVPLPPSCMDLLPRPAALPAYRAIRTMVTRQGEVRVDGREGNVSYRADKAPQGRG